MIDDDDDDDDEIWIYTFSDGIGSVTKLYSVGVCGDLDIPSVKRNGVIPCTHWRREFSSV